MARPWRIQFPQALYHVTSRGNNRQIIFLDDEDKQTFLATLATAVSRFDLHLFAFCLMDNHYHLFLRTPLGNLSRALQWLNTTYTVRFHRRHGRSGHLFQGRFKAVLIADEAHWLHVSMYIHLNPVRAGMVEDPAEYEWSSFRDYTRPGSRFGWLRPEEMLSEYGKSEAGQKRRYRQACLALAGTRPDWVEQLRSGVVLGAREVVEELAKKYRPAGKGQAVPEYTQAARRQVDGERELGRVAQAFGVTPGDLLRKRRSFAPRLAAYAHLVEHCGLGVSEVAALMKVSTAAVSMGLRRFPALRQRDPSLRLRMEQLSYK